MGRRKIPISERQHGLATTYKAGCRCDDCTSAASAYAKERYKARKAGDVRTKQGKPVNVDAGPQPLREIRMPVSCPNCGGAVVAQTESAATGSGMRVTQMLRCSTNGCNRQWQFVGVLMSLSGAEYMGAA
jgi:hypothetical protein